MEQLPENNTEQGNPSAAKPQSSLGVMFREAREQLGLSVADVAAQTKFAPRQIEALETDDFKNLPETAFLRGFVRSYAKILNLNAEILLAALPQPKAPTTELIPASVDVPFPKEYSAQKNLLMLVAALLIAVIVVGFVVWHFTVPLKKTKVEKIETPVSLPAQTKTTPAPEIQAPPAPEIQAPPVQKHNVVELPQKAEKAKPPVSESEIKPAVQATKATVASALSQTRPTDTTTQNGALVKISLLHMVFDEESWAEITDKEGKIISSRIHAPGSEMDLHGYLPLSLVIGHAPATRLYQDGKPINLTSYTNSSSEVARITLK
jgi:cytoskeleton protein RodZ